MPFIFSNKLRFRLSRHLLFWFVWILTQVAIYTLPYVFTQRDIERLLITRLLYSLVFLIPHLLIVYSLMYFVMPRYVANSRYGLATLYAVVLLLLSAALYVFLDLTVINRISDAFAKVGEPKAPGLSDVKLTTASVLSFWGIYGCITISGFALTIKFLKLWYVKEQKNIQLEKENLVSKTQLLQSQVHPHFLFNTLNNIYSTTLPTSPAASKMIMRLSSLLRYILYECNQPLVPLKKEFDMIREYIELESLRYDEKLELTMEIPDQVDHLMVAPLILLPFVENSFKHGSSNVIEKPWINFHFQLKENNLFVRIVNGKSANTPYNHAGIGISNARNRLELLYPGKHVLKVVNDEEVFAISLNIELEQKQEQHQTEQL